MIFAFAYPGALQSFPPTVSKSTTIPREFFERARIFRVRSHLNIRMRPEGTPPVCVGASSGASALRLDGFLPPFIAPHAGGFILPFFLHSQFAFFSSQASQK
jgi:hypothetical protein